MTDPAHEVARDSNRLRGRRVALILLYALALLAITDRRIVPTGALLSRLALIESLVERSTFVIDESSFVMTVDKVRMGEHYYSDKLPLLPVVSSGIYALLHHIFGLSFGTHPAACILIITYLTMGAATLALVILFHREVGRAGVDDSRALLITTSLGLATLIFTYAGTYQNHTPTALFLFAGFASLRRAREGSRGGAFLSGLFAGLAAACEMPTGFAFGCAFAICLGFGPSGDGTRTRRLGVFLAGFAVPMAVTAVILLIAWGDPRPAYLIPGAYDYPGSAFGGRQAGLIQSTRVPANIAVYAFHNLLGIRGLLSTSPILLAGVVGLGSLLARRRDARRWEGWAIVGSAAAVIAFYAVATDSYGGWAYGLRFFLPLAPMLLYFAADLPERFWRRPRVLGLAALVLISAVMAWIGAYHPWTPSYQGETICDPNADVVRWPPAGNIAAMAEEALPGSRISAWLRRRLIDPADDVGYRYLAVSYYTQSKPELRDRMMRGGR